MTPQELRQKIRSNPSWFVKEALGDDLEEYQERILSSVFKNPKTTVRSCHGIGKSFTAARTSLAFLFAYSDSIVLTTAPTWRQVEDVLWKELRSAHAKSRIDLGGSMLNARYNLGPEWFAVGLSTTEPDKFQGYHADSILIVIDESSGVRPEIFQAIEGIASTGHVRILELGNPTDPTGHFAGTFTSPFYEKISVSCFDTPNFSQFRTVEGLLASTEEERLAAVTHPHLITPQWVFERLSEWGAETPMFQARCLGEFPTEGENTLIPLRLVLAAQDRTEVPESTIETLGVDIARFGSDKTIFAVRRGNRIDSVTRYSKQDTMETVGKVVQFHKAYPYSSINPDDAGVGGGVTDRLRELGIPVNPVNVGQASSDPDRFFNLRAELYWGLRMRLEEGTISLPKDDDLAAELTAIQYKVTSKGQIQIETKEDMKKRGLHSPDIADAVMLAFAPQGGGSGFFDYYKGKGGK